MRSVAKLTPLGLVRHHWVPTLVLGGLITILYFGTFRELMGQWDTNIYYSHGYLILPIAAWLIWRMRGTLQSIPAAPSWAGLPVLIGGLALLALGIRADILFAQGLSLILVLAGVTHTLWGRRALREASFPLFVLIFMIPLPYLLLDPIGFPMKRAAAAQAASILQLFGVPILREGVYLHLPHYTLVVEDVCNGLRSLITMLTLSTILAQVLLPFYRDRLLLIASSVPISLAANIIRIMVTVLMGYYVSKELAQGFLHEFSGLFVFALSLGGLVLVGRFIAWRRERFISVPSPA